METFLEELSALMLKHKATIDVGQRSKGINTFVEKNNKFVYSDRIAPDSSYITHHDIDKYIVDEKQFNLKNT